MDEELPEDPMSDLEDELREHVESPRGVTKTDIDGARALVILVEDEGEAEELAAVDVETADGVDVIEMPSISNSDYGVAFKIEE